jgi:LPXTG-motif cell wall-anchored protein
VTGAGAPGEIPVTGTNVSLGLVILGAMILAGLGLLVMGRRKKADVNQ